MLASELLDADIAPPAPGAEAPAVLPEHGVVVVDLERDVPSAAEQRQHRIGLIVGSLKPREVDFRDQEIVDPDSGTRLGADAADAEVVPAVLLPKTSSMLVGADRRVMPILCAIAVGGHPAGGERCGMVINRAAATGLPRCDERVRAAAAATDEQPGQGRRDPRAAPPALGPAPAARSGPGPVHPGDRALLAALLHRLPRDVLNRLHLVVRPDTVLRWHRDVIARRHPRRSRPRRPGRPRTVRSIRVLVLRLVRENPRWGYRRVHGELLVLGIKVAASTVWEILHDAGIDPAPGRSSTTWADFLRSQAEVLLACDFFETVTLSGARLHVLAAIEHASRRIRIMGATAHPTASWGSPGRQEPHDGPGGCQLPGTVPDQGPGR